MKKNIIIVIIVLLILSFIVYVIESKSGEDLREEHTELLKNHSLNKQVAMSRAERKKAQLPPDQYNDELYLLTMDPVDGQTHPEELNQVLEDLKSIRASSNLNKAPGDSESNSWVNIGPSNVAGRSKVVFFDPNDATNTRVFAGAIAGGLWVNNNISNANSPWELVSGVPENMAVSCFAIDPSNPNTWYIGTGEAYTSGLTSGTGIYKSTDSGINWINILDEESAPTTISGNSILNSGRYYINDIIVRDRDNNPNTINDTEVYATIVSQYNTYSGTTFNQFDGVNDYGLYKTSDQGASWSIINLLHASGQRDAAFDLELSANNTMWISTTRNVFLDSGGTMYSYDGTNYTSVNQIPNTRRTEFAMSATNPNKGYVLVQDQNLKAKVYKTLDGFTTITEFTQPNDLEGSVSVDDFARNQAHFNLTIEVDPTDDNSIFLGAINLFKSNDGGSSYTQLTTDAGTGATSAVHADQHGLAFGNGDVSKLLLGNDGGVYFSNDGGTTFNVRETNLVTTQFYGVDVNTTGPLKVLAGAQDNGTNKNNTSNINGLNKFTEVFGGDGAYSAINQPKNYRVVSFVNNHRGVQSTNGGPSIEFTTAGGRFINPTDLDKENDIIWSDASSGTTFNVSAIYGSGVSNNPSVANISSSQFSFGQDAYTSAVKVSPYNNANGNRDVIFGLSNGRVFRINDASTIKTTGTSGLTITELTGGSFFGSISDIEFGATNDDLFVTFHNYGVQSVWYSDNVTTGSVTWQAKEGNLPNIPVKAILQNPLFPNEVIIGTELGVWHTSDFTVTSPVWEQSYNGMSSVRVTELVYRQEGNLVVASTFGRGLFVGEFVSNPLSTDDFIEIDNELIIYPTIVNDHFTIKTEGFNLKNADVVVYNMQGKTVLNTKATGTQVKIDCTLPNGLYIVKVSTTEKTIKTTKIVVR